MNTGGLGDPKIISGRLWPSFSILLAILNSLISNCIKIYFIDSHCKRFHYKFTHVREQKNESADSTRNGLTYLDKV